MPPKHPKPHNHLIKPADRLALAITGLKTGKYTSIHEAATQNAVPESTLRARVKSAGFPRRAVATTNKNTRRKEFRLTRTEENTLSNWIIQVHEGGKDVSRYHIQDMVNTLLAKRGGTHGFRVTPEWVAGYLEFHPEFATLVEEHEKYLQEELGYRPVKVLTEPRNPEATLKFVEDIVHNTTMYAKSIHEFEKYMQEDLRGRVVTEPDRVREIVVAVDEIRETVGKSLGMAVDQCREFGELIMDFDIDTTAFMDGFEELLSIMKETDQVREEMRLEFGGRVLVEES